MILGNPLASGATPILSGWPWSGRPAKPVGGVQIRWISSGGNCYIALSGNPILSGGFMTLTSGQMYLSGGANSGLLDGMPLAPGDSYFVPRLATGLSGQLSIFAICDQAASGIGRLYWEVM